MNSIKPNSIDRRVAVVRNAKRLQPTETSRHTREADAETDQIFASPQSCLQEHRKWGAARGIGPHGTLEFYLFSEFHHRAVHQEARGKKVHFRRNFVAKVDPANYILISLLLRLLCVEVVSSYCILKESAEREKERKRNREKGRERE